jgi:hypothetical protein
MTILEMVDERFEPTIEVAAYHVVADAARAAVGPIRVHARRGVDRLTIEILAREIPDIVVEEVADRVGSTDGSVERVRDGDGFVTLIAKMPLVSAF